MKAESEKKQENKAFLLGNTFQNSPTQAKSDYQHGDFLYHLIIKGIFFEYQEFPFIFVNAWFFNEYVDLQNPKSKQ